jgi:hypothetical protein
MTTLIAGSAPMAVKASFSSAVTWGFRALSTLGRLMVMVAMPSAASNRMVS